MAPVNALKLYSQTLDTFSILLALKSCTNLPHIRHLHAHILKLGFSAHVYVATCLLSVYAPTLFRDARNLFDEMPLRNTVTFNVMITAYSRQRDIQNARFLFDEMPHRNLASWSAMIAAYMDHALWNHAVPLFRQMLSTTNPNINPNQLTIGSILARCGRMGSVGSVLGKSLHCFVLKNKWEMNVELGTRLVDMYAKCGLLKNAFLVFEMMKSRNVVSWTALICGAAQHGRGEEALKMFDKMREAGVKPNELTFTGILVACVRSGLVDEGRRYFTMLDEYELRPRMEHFGCMVDLFGKAGMLGEAYEVINRMPFEANIVVWGSFLSSCKVHGEFEMADKVIDKVMKIVRPENDGGVYSLVADLYVLGGRLSEAERLRELMVKQNVRKVRASTFTSATALS